MGVGGWDSFGSGLELVVGYNCDIGPIAMLALYIYHGSIRGRAVGAPPPPPIF